ncbi:MAG: stage II sporulation protein P [Peptococcaceae bacterium]|nr:stage II sporulation protein P [Peptococcaceae bacterium]
MYPVPASRVRRGRLIPATGLVFILLFLLSRVFLLPAPYPAFFEKAGEAADRVVVLCQRDPLKLLKSAMPALDWSAFEDDTGGLTLSGVLWSIAGALAGVNLQNPAVVLQSQLPPLTAAEPSGAAETGRPVLSPAPVFARPGEALVCIYNTHTGETYSLTDGVDRLDGRQGGVVTVAAALQEALEKKYGIKVARSDRINDASYNTSYLESEKTARELLAANPGAWVVLDIHRDSGKTREQSVVKIDDQEVAPILLVVGSDARRPFPGWRQNFAFAAELSDKMNRMYPGLSLGVRVKDGLYNQFLHPRAVLVEVGTTKNSTEEAVRSARLLADVLAGLITGKKAENFGD